MKIGYNENHNDSLFWFHNSRETDYIDNVVNSSSKDKYILYAGLETANLLPQRLIYLYETSPTLQGLVNNRAKYVAGKGIKFNNPEAAEFAKTLEYGEGFEEMFRRAALSLGLFGGFSLQVTWNTHLAKVAHWYIESFENVRKGFSPNQNKQGKYDQGFYVSPEWGWVNGGVYNKNFKPVYFDAFEFDEPDHENPRIYYFSLYSPGRRYYPIPDWSGGTNAVEREVEQNIHVLSVLRQGAFPSGILVLPRKAKDIEGNKISDYLKREFKGSENAGKVICMEGDTDERAEFTPLPSVVTSTDLTHLKKDAQTDLLLAFRLPSPILLGLPSGQAMFDSGAAMESAVKVYYEREILPMQNILIREFKKFFKAAGYETEITIDQEIPVYENPEQAGRVFKSDFQPLYAKASDYETVSSEAENKTALQKIQRDNETILQRLRRLTTKLLKNGS